jgi:hypothetical protein
MTISTSTSYPGRTDASNVYERSANCGNMVIFKGHREAMHVITLPTQKLLVSPKKDEICNLHPILHVIEQMR